jgi:amino acid transporter
MKEQGQLARRIGLPLLALYGLGTILGAGIYVLVGKVAASAGLLAPLAFLIAGFIAWITALSYSQLAVLFPQSAGEALYAQKGFGKLWLTRIIGVLIIFTGVVSAATLANGFIGYLKEFVEIPDSLGIILLVLAFSALALWGIAESLLVSAVITLIEIAGLLMIILLCGDALQRFPENWAKVIIPANTSEAVGVLAGAFLAFYAFIGFEDMVNVVEEVKEPSRMMPRAIFIVIVVSGSLYILVALIAVLLVPIDQLAGSEAPMVLLLNARGVGGENLIAGISMFAIVNGILIQMIMASLYGMARQNTAPKIFASVHPTRQTPIPATLAITALVLIFALALPLVTLAKLTSGIILVIFSVMNLSLWRIGRREEYRDQLNLPRAPLLGAALCIGFLILQLLG